MTPPPPPQQIHDREPPRLSLACLPTPLVDLPNLAGRLGVPRILLKRDDLTGLELSGNKIRKLEYFLADAKAQGCDTLVTNGGYQSNHCRATSAAGARVGMKVRLILRAPPPAAGPAPLAGNLLLDRLFGAELSLHAPEEYAARRDELIAAAIAELRAAGRRPYFFPVGGSVPLGSWGYVRCVAELLSQLPPGQPADVFVAVSSSGTLGGLALGRALLKADHLRVVGVPVSDKLELFRPDVGQIIHDTIATYGLDLEPEAAAYDLLGGFIGEGYAIPTPEGLATLKLVAEAEGVLLDPTYTGKAMAGFLHAIRTSYVRPGATPVFIHTGGVFGLMARGDLFQGDWSHS